MLDSLEQHISSKKKYEKEDRGMDLDQSHPCRVIYGTSSTGSIKYFNKQKETNKIHLLEFKEYFYDLTWETIDEQIKYSEIKVASAKNKVETYNLISSLFFTFDTAKIKYKFIKYVVVDHIDVPTAYRKAVDLYVENNLEEIENKFSNNFDQLDMFIQEFTYRLMTRYEMSLVKRLLKTVDKDFILFVDEFKKEYLYDLPKEIQGIICRRVDNEELAFSLANEFELPLAIHDFDYEDDMIVSIDGVNNRIIINPSIEEQRAGKIKINQQTYQISENSSYQPSKINIYAPMVDTRNVDKVAYGDWFAGVAPFKTEYMFVTKGIMPKDEEQYKIFYDLFTGMKGKEVYIRIPDFRPERSIIYFGDIYTDPQTFDMYWEMFQTHLKAIRRAAEETNSHVNLAVPMVRMSQEISFWRNQIADAFYLSKLEHVKLGVIFETESAYEYFEEYEDMDFAMIDLNDLVEEISDDCDRCSFMTKEEVLDTFWPQLRDLHQYLRSYKLQAIHIVSGNSLTNPEVFRKFLVAGFRDFSIPYSKIKSIEHVIKEYNDSRGTYIGVAADRLEKKEAWRIKTILREKRIREIKQVRLDKKKQKRDADEQKQRDANKDKREIVIKKILEEKKKRDKEAAKKKKTKKNKKKNKMCK